jgi:short-subunit dehydrogenase
LSSVGGYQSGSGFGVYCSTKFAIEGLSEALYQELKPLGIHVTVVEPGYFRTDFLDSTSAVESKNVISVRLQEKSVKTPKTSIINSPVIQLNSVWHLWNWSKLNLHL